MNSSELIGQVAATYLSQQLEHTDRTSTARYLIDSLSAEQTAAVAKAIVANAALATLIDIKLPDVWLANQGVRSDCLTHHRATFYRNAPCTKPAMLLATPGDDERQSLADLTVIDTSVLRAQVDLWVSCASAGIPVTDQNKRTWIAALNGLNDVAQVTLDDFAQYVLRVREEMDDGGVFPDAIGVALPVLRWPRNAALFRSLNTKTMGHASKWKQLFGTVQKKQACYLRKFTPSNQALSADDLSAAFDKVKEAIPEAHHAAVRAFIAAPSKWNAQAAALADIDWELIKPLFDGLKPEKFNLGTNTLQFFDELEGDPLTKDERDYLDALSRRNSSQSTPDDEEFYRKHRLDLKDEPSLKSKWDRFIFGTPLETADFSAGLAACLQSLFDQNLPEGCKRTLLISSDKRAKGDLRSKLNVDAGLYFAMRYRGLRTLLGRPLFEVGELFDFDKLVETWVNDDKKGRRKYKRNDSTARGALEIKFYVQLTINDGEIENHRQLIWRYDPNAISSEMLSDWMRLAEHPFSLSEVAREPVGPKGQAQALDLREVRSLTAAFGQDRGSLVRAYRKEHDLAEDWRKNLASAVDQGLVSDALKEEFGALFEAFSTSYSQAIERFLRVGVAAQELTEQYVAYGRLLETLTLKARGDKLRDLLLKPLLAIGVVQVHGGAPAAIVAPWNPLRMQAMAAKAQRMRALIERLLTATSVTFGDPALFFKELRDELQHPYYPELALGWRERKPELLSITDSCMDYSLHELPLRDGEDSETNENPSQAASQIVEMVQRYLELFPHERANLSAVLYNCDSASLPQAVVNRINDVNEDDEEMRCEVFLRHRDRDKLHRLYEQILEASDNDSDSFISSEASRDFMARLRIGIMADEAPVPTPEDGPSKDVVFLHDVISRHAILEWYRQDARAENVDTLVPSRWSRRRPSPRDEEKSIVYLCCPVQTKEGWDYVTAITTFFKPDWYEDLQRRYLPARQLDFHNPDTARIFEETHNIGNWVVNFDELLDRRQLVNQGVRVIRYKQSSTQGRNLLVSSNAPLGLLQTTLIGRIRDLAPELPDERVRALSKRFIDDANVISGDLVLRAAKHGRNASELIGVVLSNYLVRHELGASKRIGCYFLDDYSEWLGEDGEQIADLLLISPDVLPDGSDCLSVCVTEAKYIIEASLAEKRKESQRQLRDSTRRIHQALFGNPVRFDRDLWLSRFSDLLLSGIPYSAGDKVDLDGLRRKVREGACRISLRGYSQIFVSGPADGSDCSDFVDVAECEGGYQEVYSREKTRALLLAYAASASPDAARYSVADRRVIEARSFELIAGAGGTSVTVRPEPSRSQPSSSPLSPAPAPVVQPASAAPPTGGGGPPPPIASPALADQEHRSWSCPQVATILDARVPSSAVTEQEREWLRATVAATRAALQQFQLNSRVMGEPVLTPNAGIIRFQGAAVAAR